MRCPVCNAPYRGERICTRCGGDLQPMLEVRNRAFVAYNNAVIAARNGEWYRALEMIDQAIEYMHSRADFFVLRGKVHAHLHRYSDALHDWRTAHRLDPDCKAAELLASLRTLVVLLKTEEASRD